MLPSELTCLSPRILKKERVNTKMKDKCKNFLSYLIFLFPWGIDNELDCTID